MRRKNWKGKEVILNDAFFFKKHITDVSGFGYDGPIYVHKI